EELPRVVAGLLPARRTDVAEELRSVLLPAPPIVAGEIAKLMKQRGENPRFGATRTPIHRSPTVLALFPIRNVQTRHVTVVRKRLSLRRRVDALGRAGPEPRDARSADAEEEPRERLWMDEQRVRRRSARRRRPIAGRVLLETRDDRPQVRRLQEA